MSVTIALQGVTVAPVSGLDLRVRAGEVLGLVGPSGCGKTRLMEVLVGLRSPAAGRVIRNPDGAAFRGTCGYVAQIAAPPSGRPDLDVGGWIRGAVEMKGWPPGAAADVIGKLGDLAPGTPLRHISAGAWRHLAVLCALAGDAGLLAVDDPDAHLDARARRDLRAGIDGARSRGATVVLAGDPAQLEALCDRCVSLVGDTTS